MTSENSRLTATIEYIMFPRDPFPDSHFVIIAVREKDGAGRKTVKGEMLWTDLQAYMSSKTEVTFTGKWETHHKYGTQLKFGGYHEDIPTNPSDINASAMTRFLTENLDGVGPVTAAEIMINAGGTGQLVQLLEDGAQQELKALHPRIDDSLALHLYSQWIEHRALMKTISFFADFEITGVFPKKIFAVFGESSIETVKEDPYILIKHIENIGFKRADEIAMKLGISKSAPVRLRASIVYTLDQKCHSAGHCFMDRQSLLVAGKKLIGVATYRIDEVLDGMLEKGDDITVEEPDLSYNGQRIYLPTFLITEKSVAEHIKRMLEA